MTQYSGRTTVLEHKRDNWQDYKGPFPPAVSQMTVFNAQWTDCPVEVEKEVKKLWRDNELGNDTEYYHWDGSEDEEDHENYPIIHEYLKSKGVTKCLIHWWW